MYDKMNWHKTPLVKIYPYCVPGKSILDALHFTLPLQCVDFYVAAPTHTHKNTFCSLVFQTLFVKKDCHGMAVMDSSGQTLNCL